MIKNWKIMICTLVIAPFGILSSFVLPYLMYFSDKSIIFADNVGLVSITVFLNLLLSFFLNKNIKSEIFKVSIYLMSLGSLFLCYGILIAGKYTDNCYLLVGMAFSLSSLIMTVNNVAFTEIDKRSLS
jgi:hypothetical protein